MDYPLRNAGMGSQLDFKRSQYGLLVEALNSVLKRLEGYCFVSIERPQLQLPYLGHAKDLQTD